MRRAVKSTHCFGSAEFCALLFQLVERPKFGEIFKVKVIGLFLLINKFWIKIEHVIDSILFFSIHFDE